MLLLLGFIALVGLGVWYITTLDFEIGSGFSEMKRRAREGEFTITKRSEENAHKPKELP